MTFRSLSVLGVITLFLMSCGNPYKLKLTSPKTIAVNQKLSISVSEKNDKPIDSIRYYLDGKYLMTNSDLNITDKRLGKHAVSATVFYGDRQKQLTNTIVFLAANQPDIYTYDIINAYPHDEKAFTQGLEFHDGFLYESTGQYGESSLRKVNLETGEIVQKKDLERQYFGEGLTIYNNKIYQLTWKSGKGFIYNLEDFAKEKEFFYGASKEGWGLAHHDTKLIKTDGTERIWFLNLEDQKEQHFIEAYTHDRKVDKLNEIEYINGKIYSNKWQQNSILIINPKNGEVEGIADLKGLQPEAGQKGNDNVLNGIAYDAENDRLFVTGKRWNKLFEIKLKKKQ
ncbi:MAG: glutaminyl-peptide cyclotransferase [Flavobacteriaceae bacterium]|nr:glutaminyl-peptide cyclotransferase [Flavobacteriaceae bacterium]